MCFASSFYTSPYSMFDQFFYRFSYIERLELMQSVYIWTLIHSVGPFFREKVRI